MMVVDGSLCKAGFAFVAAAGFGGVAFLVADFLVTGFSVAVFFAFVVAPRFVAGFLTPFMKESIRHKTSRKKLFDGTSPTWLAMVREAKTANRSP